MIVDKQELKFRIVRERWYHKILDKIVNHFFLNINSIDLCRIDVTCNIKVDEFGYIYIDSDKLGILINKGEYSINKKYHNI